MTRFATPRGKRLSLKRSPDEAFAAWLDHGLREQFTAVMAEPVPQEMRNLIEGTAAAPDDSADGVPTPRKKPPTPTSSASAHVP